MRDANSNNRFWKFATWEARVTLRRDCYTAAESMCSGL